MADPLMPGDPVRAKNTTQVMTFKHRLYGGLVRCEWSKDGVKLFADFPSHELTKVTTQ